MKMIVSKNCQLALNYFIVSITCLSLSDSDSRSLLPMKKIKCGFSSKSKILESIGVLPALSLTKLSLSTVTLIIVFSMAIICSAVNNRLFHFQSVCDRKVQIYETRFTILPNLYFTLESKYLFLPADFTAEEIDL